MIDLNDAPRQQADIRVTDTDAHEDAKWFADHSKRQYRVRAGWAVRQRGKGVFLRTPIADDRAYFDDERSAEGLWWSAAWPDLDPAVRDELTKTARRSKSAGNDHDRS